MLGAIAGDIIGSVYEGIPIKRTDFKLLNQWCTFTDDTVLTIATADCILHKKDFAVTYREYCKRYPNAAYGGYFIRWAFTPGAGPYNSLGNGSAMRVSPIGFAYKTLDEVLKQAKESAQVTHNHLEGIKGAQAVASAIFLARTGKKKEEIEEFIEKKFSYNLGDRIEDIQRWYSFDPTCPGSVPQAIIAFLESENYEDAIRKAISLGGDSDTLACMAGGIAEAYYGIVPKEIKKFVFKKLDKYMPAIINEFYEKYINVK